MLIRYDRFAPSRRPYAFVDRPGTATLEAIWFGRKRGQLVVTIGHYGLWAPQGVDLQLPIDERLALADTRYGGSWHHRWDGERLLSEPSHLLDPASTADLAARLDTVLRNAPAVPAGMHGWFYPE